MSSDNSNSNNDTDLILPDELASLKTRADLLGIKFHPSISLEKLREKVNATITDTPIDTADLADPVDGDTNDPVKKAVAEVAETENQLRFRKKREANELLRVRVSCMNPTKSEWDGEIFTAGNSLVGSFKKYVPFNGDEGWHIPRIIYNQLLHRECQIFVSSKDARGNNIRVGKIIREFAIEVMPPLTEDELTELARRQAASNAIG